MRQDPASVNPSPEAVTKHTRQPQGRGVPKQIKRDRNSPGSHFVHPASERGRVVTEALEARADDLIQGGTELLMAITLRHDTPLIGRSSERFRDRKKEPDSIIPEDAGLPLKPQGRPLSES